MRAADKRLKAAHFNRAFESGRRFSDRDLRLVISFGDGRWGVAVSKKLKRRNPAGSTEKPPNSVGPACHARRNRVKRRARAAVESIVAELRPGNDYVFMVLAEGERLSLDSLRSAMLSLLRKAHITMDNEEGSIA